MVVPDNIPLLLKQGVYAARAKMGEEKYSGMLYYGPAVAFDEKEPALEIYLFDTAGLYVGEGEKIDIEIRSFVRGVMDFEIPELLVEQMVRDEAKVREILGL